MTTAHESQVQESPQAPVSGGRVSLQTAAPGFARAMAQLQRASTSALDEAGIDHRLAELVKIRASQLNGCAYCLDMHTKDARSLGESEQRLYALPAWREAPFYSARERAALAFAESVTLVAGTHVADADYAAVAAEFTGTEIAALLTAIVTINSWNRIVAATRAYEVGSYQPPRA